MIQFNLLPDVKLQYIKTERTKHLVTTVSLLASAAAVFIFVVLFLTVKVWQEKTINDLSKNIQTASAELQATPDLNKILTVQNQLGKLTSLHDTKFAAKRLFGYLSQVTPTDATISDISADLTLQTLTITGNAPSLDDVNIFTDALKFTKFQEQGQSEKSTAFSNVVLSSFGRSGDGATYTITLNYDPAIFDNTKSVKLLVPNIVTTRSVIEQPSVLFEQNNPAGGQ